MKFTTPAQAARRLDVAAETVRAYCRRGLIGRRVLGRYRLDPAEIDALLAGRLPSQDAEGSHGTPEQQSVP